MLYGLVSPIAAVEMSVAVCNVLGHGKLNNASLLLVETAAAESMLGTFRDPTERYAGSGLCQIDEGTFDWLKEKFAGKKEEEQLRVAFGFTLSKVTYPELELSPLLSFVFARLRYRVETAEIPATLEGRAEYWKQHYNTHEGDGTPEQYVKKAKNLVPTTLFSSSILAGY